MTIPQKYEFEGAQRSVREIYEMLGGVIPRNTVRDRLSSGQKTAAELRRPKPRYVNTAWNNSMFGKGHTA